MSKIRLPSPALVIAVIALFVALGGTAFATVNAIVPKAKLSLNSLKLQGKTAAQVAAIPGPATSAAGLVAVRTVSFSLGAGGVQQVSAACQSGEKAVGGGYSTSGAVLSATSAPSSDGSSWQMVLVNFDSSAGTSGTGYAVCLK
jgi:hypothetical protein